MRDVEFMNRADEVTTKLGDIQQPCGSGVFFGTIDEVDSLCRDFVNAVAEGALNDVTAVARRLAQLNTTAEALL